MRMMLSTTLAYILRIYKLIATSNLTIQFGPKPLFENVNIKFADGNRYGLIGANGAGKTSLIRIINQITMPDSGQVILDGEPLRPEHVGLIGYMPKEKGL